MEIVVKPSTRILVRISWRSVDQLGAGQMAAAMLRYMRKTPSSRSIIT